MNNQNTVLWTLMRPVSGGLMSTRNWRERKQNKQSTTGVKKKFCRHGMASPPLRSTLNAP